MLVKLQNFFARVPLWICALAIFAVALGARIHWIGEKRGFHLDEAFSVQLALYNPHYPWEDDAKARGGVSRTFSCGELKKACYSCDPGVPAALDTIRKLREDNRDSPHTNFYYSLLRAAWIGNDGETSVDSLKRRGCALNLLFFAGTFVAMFALLKRLFGAENKGVICAGLAAASLCTGAISNTVFMRPYALQEPFFVLFTLGFLVLWDKIRAGEPIVSIRNFLLCATLTALTLLTAYFAVVYVILLFAVLAFFALRGNEKKSVAFLGAIFAGALALAIAAYPNYPDGFFGYRGQEAAGKFALDTLGQNLSDSMSAVSASLCDALYYAPLLALLAVFVVWSRLSGAPESGGKASRPQLQAPLIVAVALAWASACMFLAPYKTMRYVMPMFPILSLLVPWIVARCAVRKRALLSAGTVAVFGVCAFTAKGTDDGVASQQGAFAPPFSQVEQIFPEKTRPFVENLSDSKHAVVMISEKYPLGPHDPLLSIPDHVKLVYVSDPKELERTIEREQAEIVMIQNDSAPLPESENRRIQKVKWCWFFDVYRIDRAAEEL